MINIKQKDGRTEETVYVLVADAITCQKPFIYLWGWGNRDEIIVSCPADFVIYDSEEISFGSSRVKSIFHLSAETTVIGLPCIEWRLMSMSIALRSRLQNVLEAKMRSPSCLLAVDHFPV